MEFVQLAEEEFKSVQDILPGASYYQTTNWARIKADNGWKYLFVGVIKENQIIAASLILWKEVFLKRKIFYAPRGFLLNYQDFELLRFFTSELKKFIKGRKGILVKIDPLVEYQHHNAKGQVIPDGFSGSGICLELMELGYRHKGFTVGYTDEIQCRWSYCLDLSLSREALLSGMDKRCRRCIRKYEKYPLVTVDVDETNMDDFKAIMEHTAIRHHHFDRSKQYYQSLQNHMEDRVKMLVVYLDRNAYLKNNEQDKLYEKIQKDNRNWIPLSAGVFIFDTDRVHYVYGGTYACYMPLMAQYKLQMDMIDLALARGIPVYDFDGISGDFSEGSPNYGVYEFKRGFGGYAVEYIGEFDLIICPWLYHLYNAGYQIYRQNKKWRGKWRKRFARQGKETRKGN